MHRVIYLAFLGFGMAILAGLAFVLAGPGTHWGWWDFKVGLAILKWSAYGGLAALVVSLLSFIISLYKKITWQAFYAILGGLLLGGIVFGIPWQMFQKAQRVPPIHDITTDMVHPPPFVSILPLRKTAANPAEYGGRTIAAQQKIAYPDLKPLILSLPPAQAFQKALETVQNMGWEIVASVPAEGRIEATDTTFWFGFKDDIVIRIVRLTQGSCLDIRSVSRVGRSDIGTNAQRIRNFLNQLNPSR